MDAIRAKVVVSKPSSIILGRTVGLKEKRLPDDVLVRYLYQPGELEGGQHRRATDAIWSLQVYRLARSVAKSGAPIVYYMEGGPKSGFVREELLVVPPDTELPPSNTL